MMTIDWNEKADPPVAGPSGWTLERIADWKRSLSTRFNSHRRTKKINPIEGLDMARLWDLLDLSDRKIRERDSLPAPGPRPDWVRRAFVDRG